MPFHNHEKEMQQQEEQQHHCPTTNGGMQNGSSVGVRTQCTHIFARLPAGLRAQWVLINKISASELSRKFIKECVVGWVLVYFSLSLSLSLCPSKWFI